MRAATTLTNNLKMYVHFPRVLLGSCDHARAGDRQNSRANDRLTSHLETLAFDWTIHVKFRTNCNSSF